MAEPEPIRAVCPLCEAMCGIRVGVEGGTVVSVRPDPDDPLSMGAMCPKAAALVDLHADPDRLRHPVKRTDNGWERVGWDEALDAVAADLHRLQQEGGRDAVGVYLGNPNAHNLGMMTFGPSLWRSLGTRNRYSATSVDQLPHQLAATLMLGHQLLMPVPDVDRTQMLLVIGANPLVSNGSLMSAPGMRRRLDALRARGGRLVVVDPRRTETADRADEHVFVRPGTDAAWMLALVHTVLTERGASFGDLERRLGGHEGIRGLAALKAAADRFTPEAVAGFTGIDAATTRRLALELADTPKAVVYPRFGACTQAYGGLCLWLGTALNAITGHLDAEGGAMLTEPAVDAIHPPVGRGIGRGHLARWRSRVGDRPEFAGELPVAGLAEEILTPGDGKLRGLLVWAGNPVLSTPNGARLDEALAALDVCVAVDYYVTETSRHAKYILPPVAPLARPHYDVVFHSLAVRNTARWCDPVVPPDGDLRHDWQIVVGLVERLNKLRGAPLRDRLKLRAMAAFGPAGQIDLALRLGKYGVRARGMRGLSVRALRRAPAGVDLGPLRPCLPERMVASHRHVELAPQPYLDDVPRLWAEVEAASNAERSLVLIGRRQLHGLNTWLHNTARLVKAAKCTLLVHPDDAAAAGITPGGWAEVRSRVGAVVVPVEVTDAMMRGVVSLPHGWGHGREGVSLRVASKSAGASVNDLTDDAAIDPMSGNAALSGVPVRVSPAEPPAAVVVG